MPELPEVETFKRYGEKHFLNQEIKSVFVEDEKILLTSKLAFDSLIGLKILKFFRRGKYVYAKISDSNLWLLLHFGMSGHLEAYSNQKPKSTRFALEMVNVNLGFVNPRKFGRVGIIEDVQEFFQSKSWGKDALQISEKDFLEKMSGKTGPIKSRLLDQKNVAGIGNIYADEILFQCGIHPNTDASNLKEFDLINIHSKMLEVFELAIKKQAKYHTYPKNYLLFDRSLERANPPLSVITVGGRTTYYSPELQQEI